MNVLVTGGAGFIGSNFVRYILHQSSHYAMTEPCSVVVNLDALTYAGSLENLKDLPNPERHVFVQGDICDRPLVDDLLRRYQIDTLIHFAAETILGTYTLLEAVRKYWQEEKALPMDKVRMHHVSTDEVFGSLAPEEPAFQETTPYAPNSPYAATKAAADHLARAYYHTYGLPISITNCSNNYGPYMYPEKLIPLMIFNAVEGRPLPV